MSQCLVGGENNGELKDQSCGTTFEGASASEITDIDEEMRVMVHSFVRENGVECDSASVPAMTDAFSSAEWNLNEKAMCPM